MKRLFTLVCVMALSLPVFGQRVERRNADISDLIPLLKAAGYELYSFEIKDVENIEFVIREYSDGKMLRQTEDGSIPGNMIERINIGFYPSGSDSIRFVQFNIPGLTAMNRPLKLHRLDVPKRATSIMYGTLSFKLTDAKGFIPLVLLGSGWWDEKNRITRLCGSDDEIDPDLSNEIIKNIPHYYVIGVNVK